MCLIHIRPARDPSPEPMVVPSRPITRGTPTIPLSPQSYPSPRASRPDNVRRSGSQLKPNPRASAISPRASSTLGAEPLQRLSIHSTEQWESQLRKQRERESERQRERESPPAPLNFNPPSAPIPPRPAEIFTAAPRTSNPRVPPSPRTSASRLPTIRRGSDYTYGSTPVPTLTNGTPSITTTAATPRLEPAPPISPAFKDKENIPLTSMAPPPSKPPHRRRESGVSVTNSKDGSLVERPAVHRRRESGVSIANGKDGSLVERPGGHKRSSSLSVGPRGSVTGPRRSAGDVGLEGGGLGGGGGDWGGNPRSSQRSVRERVVIVEEGRRRREYVRWEG